MHLSINFTQIEQHVHPSFLSFTSVFLSFVEAFKYFLLSSLDFVDFSVFDSRLYTI